MVKCNTPNCDNELEQYSNDNMCDACHAKVFEEFKSQMEGNN